MMSKRTRFMTLRPIERRAWWWRATALIVVTAQAVLGIPVIARSAVSSDPNLAPATPPPSAPRVKVNRTVPIVTAPPLEPRFSSAPSAAEITRARVFDEPLLPVGGTPTPAENRALSAALLAFHRSGGQAWASTLGQFLTDHPQSVWEASLRANLGIVQSRAHAYAAALDQFDHAWMLAKDRRDSAGRAVADSAIADWLTLAASFGQVDRVEQRLEMLGGRSFSGVAGVKIARARETASLIKQYPDATKLCGPEALRALIDARGRASEQQLKTLASYHGAPQGMALVDLQVLARRTGVELTIVDRTTAEDVPTPAIVHWKIGHFATIVEHQRDMYRIVDRARRESYWIDRDTLFQESSGHFLLVGREPPVGWARVTSTTARLVRGAGPLCPDGAAPPSPPPTPPVCPTQNGSCGNGGMAGYEFQQVTASLILRDKPLFYSPPVGSAISFSMSYHQREAAQPQTFTFANVGPKWHLDLIRYVKEEPTDGLGVTPAHVWVALPPGGEEAYIGPDAQGVYPAHWDSRAVLVHVSENPLRYERRLPDGTVEVYGQGDGAPIGSRRIFLTQIVDPQTQVIALTWDGQSRLVGVTDAIGQVSTIEYGLAADPLKITAVTDPFGRRASFTYNGTGELETITDVIGLTSRFSYGDDDLITKLTTPYGVTTFRSETPALNSNYTMRFIEATDPLGGTEHLEFQYQTPTVDATAPTGEVPTEFEAWNTNLDHFNTFAWDKRAWAAGPGDLTKATVTHWLEAPEFEGWQIYSTAVPHSVKRPLEHRVWYSYPGQTGASARMAGWWKEPTSIARVLDDGTSQISRATYNEQGGVLTQTDPAGRQTSYTYDTNGIDLLTVRQTTGGLSDLLGSYSNYELHRPHIVTDEAGQTTQYTYNIAGQITSVISPLQEVTTYTYDTNGYLTSSAAPLGAVTTFGYDQLGRLRTTTDSDGYSVTRDYDQFDRQIRTTYPDGSYESKSYDRLDLSSGRDRLGRVTRYYYDDLRHLVGTRDPLGRIVTQTWCGCGSLDAIIDARGHTTTWQRDLEGRVTGEVRSDGTTVGYVYEATTSRLLQRVDAKGQVTSYGYSVDDAIAHITYANVTVPTPSVSFAYDAAYLRLASVTDGAGTTVYSYRSTGTLGAGQVASVDGPLPNDTVTYTYDAMGRVANRGLASATDSWSYDSLGRLTNVVDPIGTFTWTYDGASDRVSEISYPNGQTSSYVYSNNIGDHRLQQIEHKTGAGTTLSRFGYAYDAVGNVTTWTQQYESTSRAYDLIYDAADQLKTASYRTTDPTPSVLTRYMYWYDPAGNRIGAQTDDAPLAWTYDAMNRVTSQGGAALLQFEGTVNEPATMMVGGRTAVVDASGRFTGAAPVTNGTNTVTITARDANGNTTTQAYEVDVTNVTHTFSHDGNGNLISDGVSSYDWDAENRLVAIRHGSTTVATFAYDYTGRRVRKTVAGVTHTFVYDGGNLLEERIADAATIDYVHGGLDRPLAQRDQTGAVSYYLADHLGSIVQVTGNNATVTLTRQYDPWGNLLQGGSVAGYAFTGREWDPETELYFFRSRYYSPEVGRFISEDPAGLVGGLNRYAYVGNNAINRIDPDGRSIVDCLKAIAELIGATQIVDLRVAEIIAHGGRPDPGHVKALQQAVNRVNNAMAKVRKYCSCYAAAAAALTAAEAALNAAAPYLLMLVAAAG